MSSEPTPIAWRVLFLRPLHGANGEDPQPCAIRCMRLPASKPPLVKTITFEAGVRHRLLRGTRSRPQLHVRRNMDRLQQAKSRPLLVEDAVRTALRDAIAWRIGGGRPPSADAFVGAAVASARLAIDVLEGDSAERSRTLAAVQRGAHGFTHSALFRRLMKLPAAQFLRLARGPHDADVIIRDRRRRLHAITLTVTHDALEAGRIASRVAAATPLSVVDRLTPLTVHVFSLATAQRHAFERDVCERPANQPGIARVA
jgi:hypothetical protein